MHAYQETATSVFAVVPDAGLANSVYFGWAGIAGMLTGRSVIIPFASEVTLPSATSGRPASVKRIAYCVLAFSRSPVRRNWLRSNGSSPEQAADGDCEARNAAAGRALMSG